jgi:hypothetical protein
LKLPSEPSFALILLSGRIALQVADKPLKAVILSEAKNLGGRSFNELQ